MRQTSSAPGVLFGSGPVYIAEVYRTSLLIGSCVTPGYAVPERPECSSQSHHGVTSVSVSTSANCHPRVLVLPGPSSDRYLPARPLPRRVVQNCRLEHVLLPFPLPNAVHPVSASGPFRPAVTSGAQVSHRKWQGEATIPRQLRKSTS